MQLCATRSGSTPVGGSGGAGMRWCLCLLAVGWTRLAAAGEGMGSVGTVSSSGEEPAEDAAAKNVVVDDGADEGAEDDGGGGGGGSVKMRNFVAVDWLTDGEMERRVHFNGVSAKETSVVTTGEDGKRQGIILRQLTDGAHFIQLIYSAGEELRDCEFVRQRHVVNDFLRSFREDVARAHAAESAAAAGAAAGAAGATATGAALGAELALRNVTFRALGSERSSLPDDVARWLDYPLLRARCQRSHRELRRLVRRQRHGSAEEKRHAAEHIERFKRGISENFIVPGTKWCGPHQIASRYSELGPMSVMDRCCRHHDNCKASILPFTNKYNMFNFRPFTISHCHCDTRFRTCLKMTNTAAANLVGKLFFNVVQTKCFVLKPRKVCLRMSWWGKCEKYGLRKQAHLRNNVPY